MNKKSKKIKPLTKQERELYLKDFNKPFDFANAERLGIFIKLDKEIIQYFKALAEENGTGYQGLIQEALRHYKENKLKPKVVWE